jgi:hypothetical protein
LQAQLQLQHQQFQQQQMASLSTAVASQRQQQQEQQSDAMEYTESEFTDELAYLTDRLHVHETKPRFMPYIL